MPGRMGGKTRTVKNVWVYKIDPARNLMWVRGQVWYSYFKCLSILNGKNQEVIAFAQQLQASESNVCHKNKGLTPFKGWEKITLHQKFLTI